MFRQSYYPYCANSNNDVRLFLLFLVVLNSLLATVKYPYISYQ
nr:MAG TPA: hypothetical protein [Caudoviricetes sp.]